MHRETRQSIQGASKTHIITATVAQESSINPERVTLDILMQHIT